MICESCGYDLQVGDYPFCHGDPTQHGRGATGVTGDECDFVQENGFAVPTRFTSKQEFKRALAERGLENRVCNAGVHDKIVPRMVTMDPYTMWAAEQLATRNGGSKGKDAEPDPAGGLDVSWTVRTLA